MDVSGSSANQRSEEDNEVDILECGNWEDEFQEEEEILCEASSSSFGDSMCARDDDVDGEGEEAQSMLIRDYPLPDNGTEFLDIKKKKLNDDWRRFSQPLMWRCKWLELKVKEIESQAKCYEKEVKNYYEKSGSIPDKVFKRRRRKRVEETTDVAAYMLNHHFYSYAGKRKPQYPDPDCGTGRNATSKGDDNCVISGLDYSDGFLAKILCKIDEVQERSKRLKKRVDHLTIESEPLGRNQSEVTVQIGRQRISADHSEDLLMTQAPPAIQIQIGGQCLINDSPLSSGGLRFHTILEDLLIDESENETETGEENFDHFAKLMDHIAGVPSLSAAEGRRRRSYTSQQEA